MQAVKDLDGAPYDLPRACFGLGDRTAILGDKRNDENLIIAQLHRTMLHFHNAVCTEFPEKSFEEVRLIVIQHYQQILLNQFLPLIVGKKALKEALEKLWFYRIGPCALATQPFIPLEFSGAAYRYGHSMVRSVYNFNRVFPQGTDFRLAFTFTGDGGFFGHLQYPTNWLLDWSAFFPGLGAKPQMAGAIDASLSDQLMIGGDPAANPPVKGIPLARLNLLRSSRHYRLPTGQAVAARMSKPVLTRAQLESGTGGRSSRSSTSAATRRCGSICSRRRKSRPAASISARPARPSSRRSSSGCSRTILRACSTTRRARCCLRPMAPSRSATCSTSSRSTRASRIFRRRA
nr:peroxidase family protein [Variovorax paradoxus]